jgi:protein-S-isoprenylcysteine O-methyltransferase Ste14
MSIDYARQALGAPWIGNGTPEWAARVIVILVFTALAVLSLSGAFQAVTHWSDEPVGHKLLYIAARLSNALFLALVAATTVTRLRPVRKAEGIQPRVAALLGTFLATTLALLPPAQLASIWLALSSALVVLGALLSFVVLRWLGRSFSIMAEARRLVTDGPYAIVRHPLYICEEIALVGVVIQVISPLALLIAAIHGLLQFRRMLNEETILRSTFPEYEQYADCTPRLIPRLRRSIAK